MAERSEKAILNDTLIAITALPGVMAWRNNTGQAWQGRPVNAGVGQMIRVKPGMKILEDARPIRFGLPGSGDIIGVQRGRGFTFEMKSATGRLEKSQPAFARAWKAAGGLYGLPRSVEEALAVLRGE